MNLRTFLDVKRLACIQILKNFRDRLWFLDYLKCIVKPLQTLNNDVTTLTNHIIEYVNYNGQSLSLETFINDKYDPIDRGFWIFEKNTDINVISLYGYSDDTYQWVLEYDPNPTSLSGYYNYSTDEWVLESGVGEDEISLYGYWDSVNEVWVDELGEELAGVDFIVNIPTYIYDSMTEEDFIILTNEISRYVISPRTFGYRRSSLELKFNGTNDYIETGIIPNDETKIELHFSVDDTITYQGMGISDGSNRYQFTLSDDSVTNRITWGNSGTLDTLDNSNIIGFDGLHKIAYDGGSYSASLSSYTNGTSSISFWLGALRGTTPFPVITYANINVSKIIIEHNGEEYILVATKYGYFRDYERNKNYYNRGESSNLYPLGLNI